MGFWAIFFAPFTTFCDLRGLDRLLALLARLAGFEACAAALADGSMLSWPFRLLRHAASPVFHLILIVPSYGCNVALFQFGDIQPQAC